VLVGGIFNSVNKGIYAAREDMNSPKNRYMLKDVQDSAREAGLKIAFPPKVFPVNSVKAMRGCLWIAQDAAAQPHYLEFIEATFAAYFTREEDISQDEVLAAICRQVGIDADAFLAGHRKPDIKEQLKANTDEAIRAALSVHPPSLWATTCISATTGWRWCARPCCGQTQSLVRGGWCGGAAARSRTWRVIDCANSCSPRKTLPAFHRCPAGAPRPRCGCAPRFQWPGSVSAQWLPCA
jgi:2-hydroxychromene-2-carboxylate isomerase